jgi:hypothetical protein
MTAAQSKQPKQEGIDLSQQHRLKWHIDYLEETGILYLKVNGLMNWENEKIINQEALDAGRKKNVRAFLLDQRQAVMGLSVLEIDRLPSMLRDIGFEPQDKFAVLINPDPLQKPLFDFLQDVCSLSSLQIRLFNDYEKAISWLKKKT